MASVRSPQLFVLAQAREANRPPRRCDADAHSDDLSSTEGGEVSPKPDWLVQREAAENEQIDRLSDLGVDEVTVDKARQQIARERTARI